MKELGQSSTSNYSSSKPTTSSADADVMLGQLTLRLDDKWERFAANFAIQLLNLGREVVQCFKIVAYASSVCLLLYGTSCIIRAIRQGPTNPQQEA